MWKHHFYEQLCYFEGTSGSFDEYVGGGSDSFHSHVFGFHAFDIVFDVYGGWCQGICFGSGIIGVAVTGLDVVFDHVFTWRGYGDESFDTSYVDINETVDGWVCQVSSYLYRTVRELVCF